MPKNVNWEDIAANLKRGWVASRAGGEFTFKHEKRGIYIAVTSWKEVRGILAVIEK